jgi:hypothetical protein
MYNETILEALKGYTTVPKDDMGVSNHISQALTDNGYPDILCLGIFNGSENLFEGVLVDGGNMGAGPIFKFTYDWDGDEFTEL